MRMMRTGSYLTLSFLAATLVAGCATSSEPGKFAAAPAPPANAEYVVQSGDTLQIKFYYHPDHDQEVIVRTDGKLLLPLVGEMQAAGLTPAKLADAVAKAYSTNLRDPKVSVTVKAMNENRVYVGGEVGRPGFVQYRPGLTAIQALLEVGGPKDSGKIQEVVLLQREGQAYRASKIDLSKAIEQGDTSADAPLGPTDVIFVPKTTIAKVNQWVREHITDVIPFRAAFGATLPLLGL
jgi:protein involved in polysaccharide export with SLBB domain